MLEAFQYGRPVICSDIGGMSEKVTDGVSGLHFRRRDPEHLAEVMQRAAETPGLWEELRAGIPPEPPRSMDDHVEILGDLYRAAARWAERRTGRRGASWRESRVPDAPTTARARSAVVDSGTCAELELPGTRRPGRRGLVLRRLGRARR